jgi:NAD(P)-dependent dehydrogenase (short-subunit alcohol dehydrogenase family)
MATSYTININGVAATVLSGTVHIVNMIGQRSQATFQAYDSTGAVFYGQGSHVEIYDETAALVYAGFVERDRITKPGFQPLLIHDITCKDMHYLADKRLAASSYLLQAAGVIVLDLFNKYLSPEGVTVTPTSITLGAVISEAIFNYEPVSKCLDSLAQQTGYWWQIDQNKVLWFQPYGGIPAPWVLDGTQVDQIKGTVFEEGNPQYVNRQFATGSYDKTPTLTENTKGDGATRAFALGYQMSSAIPIIQVNGVAQTTGRKGQDSGFQWYYAEGDQTVTQDVSGALLTSSDTLTVTYRGRFPVVALAANNALIASQQTLENTGTGYVESKYHNARVTTLASAFGVASSLLSHYGARMRTLSFLTQKKGLAQGQLLTVNLVAFGLINTPMLIQSVEITDSIDELNYWFVVQAVGSPADITWQSYFQGLIQGTDLLDPVQVGANSVLAIITQWTAAWGWTTGALTQTQYTCPICGNATLCGNATIIC